jgi:hypothetical protein
VTISFMFSYQNPLCISSFPCEDIAVRTFNCVLFFNARGRLYCNYRQFLVCKHAFPLSMQLGGYCSGIAEPSISSYQWTQCNVPEDFSHQELLYFKSSKFARMLMLLTSRWQCWVRILVCPPAILKGFHIFLQFLKEKL